MADVLDDVAAAAVDLAREAAESEGRGLVGAYVGAVPDGERLVSHLFECTAPAYPGWRWSVTVARASRAKVVTVDEVVLMPGPDALVAPAWVPWADRVQPGDLGVGDVLPHRAFDPLLAEGFSGSDDLEGLSSQSPLQPGAWEIGLGRTRVLSADGLLDAAERWAEGEQGPRSAMALAAPGLCSSCGYLMTIGGALGQAFGVCAAPLSPADGRVVALDYGCGAHSEATKAEPEPEPARADLELVNLATYEPPAEIEPILEEALAAELTREEMAAVVAEGEALLAGAAADAAWVEATEALDDQAIDADAATIDATSSEGLAADAQDADAPAAAAFNDAVAEALSIVDEVVGGAKAAFAALVDKVAEGEHDGSESGVSATLEVADSDSDSGDVSSAPAQADGEERDAR